MQTKKRSKFDEIIYKTKKRIQKRIQHVIYLIIKNL
jgi:hypothetical protein